MNKLAVLLIGTHGSGKSSICANVLEKLQTRGINAWASRPEDSVPRAVAASAALYQDIDHDTQMKICWRVVLRMVQALEDHDVVLVDRFLVDSLAYISTAPKLAGTGLDGEVESVLRFFMYSIKLPNLIFVPEPNFKPEADGFRNEDEQYRQAIHVLILGHLQRLGLEYNLLTNPDLEGRVDHVFRVVENLWANLRRDR